MKQLEFEMDSKEILPDIIEYKWSKKTKIFLGLLISFTILLILILVLLLIGAKKVKDDRDDYEKERNILKHEKDEYEKEINDLNNQIENNSMIFMYYNVTYADINNPIKNTFKKGGEHYIEELGEINNGSDYEYTYNNQYDLYIPYTATQRKEKYNRVILDIHGGAWLGGDKRYEPKVEFCKSLAKLGFITASMEYTFLDVERYNNVNIYRLVDEIIAAVKNIKNFLKNEGFDENKLELCLTGDSAGAHLSLLYSYLVKNSPIPTKFIVNIVGPVTLESQNLYRVTNLDEPLDNIDQESIDKALKESKIQPFKAEYLKEFVAYLNIWVGDNKKADFYEMFDNVTQTVKTDSEIYKAKLEKAKYAFPINNVEKDTIPTLCVYAGKDIDVGIGHYSLLKSYFDKKGNKNIELIYSKYSSHNVFVDPPEVKDKLFTEIYSKLLNYSDKYFSKD